MTFVAILIMGLIIWGIYAVYHSQKYDKWLNNSTRQDEIHPFEHDLPQWLDAAYTNLNQYLQTQGINNDWSIEVTFLSSAVIKRCCIRLAGSQGIILDNAHQQLFYYKTKEVSELHALQRANANPIEAFEYFTLPYSDVFKAQLVTSSHTYTQVQTKGGISRGIAGAVIGGIPGAVIGASTAKQHTTAQTVYDKLTIIIQSKNLNHPYLELDFSNNIAVIDMWKILQTTLGHIFETDTQFTTQYTDRDTDIKIWKRFSVIPSLSFPLAAIGPTQLNMLNQALFRLESIAQTDSSDS